MSPGGFYVAMWAAIMFPPLLIAYAVAALVWLALRRVV